MFQRNSQRSNIYGLISFVLLSSVVFTACVPAIMMASKVTISAISAAASGNSSGDSSEVETEKFEIPDNKSEVHRMYTNCLRKRSNNPNLDYSRYWVALKEHSE